MPDINTLSGSSTHSRNASRRTSTNPMPPPPVPASPSFNILPSNQAAVGSGSGQIPSPLPSPVMHQSIPAVASQPPVEAVVGPGPLRHPRPLTAAELHQQLEREQEAVVNRLTRELALLRAAQNASVVSNTSSTSASATGPDTNPDTHLLSGTGYSFPTPRHRRTSSNTSARSQATSALLSSSVEARRGPPAPATPHQQQNLSRQSSLSRRRSQAGSPGPQNLYFGDGAYSYLQQQRVPHTSVPGSSVAATPGSVGGSYVEQLSPGLLPGTARYEETVFHRSELETAKRENEALKRRIRDLERMVRDQRASDASRTRSESVSTTASVSVAGVGGGVGIAGPRDGRPTERDRGASIGGGVSVGVPEDEVKFGESAASAGLR